MTQPRKQKQKYAVGDIFAIPLADGVTAYARIINLQDGWDLAELFRETSESTRPAADFSQATTLYPPFFFDIRDVERGSLKIVACTDNYKNAYLDRLQFHSGIPNRREVFRVNQYKPDGLISGEVASRLPERRYYALERMIKVAKGILDADRLTSQWLETL